MNIIHIQQSDGDLYFYTDTGITLTDDGSGNIHEVPRLSGGSPWFFSGVTGSWQDALAASERHEHLLEPMNTFIAQA